MHPGESSKALLFAAILSLVILVAGCGGDGQSGNGGAQEGNGGSDVAREQGGAAKKDAREVKIALGTVKFVNVEKEKFSLKPSADVQGEKFLAFKLTPGATITLDGQQAEPADMKKGQQAQVEYVAPNNEGRRNGARVVKLFASDTTTENGRKSDEGEETG